MSNKKNKGIIPIPKDKRVLKVPIGCGNCMECKKQKAREWSVRLQEEIRTNTKAKFVTLTFSTESLIQLNNDIEPCEGYERDNAIATRAVRLFLERWRKHNKTSVKHWLITELGQAKKAKYKTTEHLHLHGIIFTDNKDEILKHWQYGYVYIGTHVNESTIQYIVKYVSKPDVSHPDYKPKILASPGIGANYINRPDAKRNQYNNNNTVENYVTRSGTKLALPIYYRNKLYTEEQREQLWLNKLDQQIRWVNGQKIPIHNGFDIYYKVLQTAQAKNRRLKYGDNQKDWQKIHYQNELRNLNFKKRIAKLLDNKQNK